jgi:putative endonuclease
MNNRKKGTDFESQAASYLEAKGYRVLERNFRCRIGEIDLIALDPDADEVVFAEVKYRADRRAGLPEEAVTYAKARTICRVADYYRMRCGFSGTVSCRFDVIAVEGREIRHYRNAFDYTEE